MKQKLNLFFISTLTIMMLFYVSQNCLADESKITSSAKNQDNVIPPEMSEIFDPIFGIKYRPKEIHFENAPKEVYKCFPKIPRRALFLFGQVLKSNVTFYLVYGWGEVLPDIPDGVKYKGVRHFAADDDATIVVISSNGCNSIIGGFAWSPDKSDRQHAERLGITEEITSELLTDAFDREVKSFGGKDKFLGKLAAARVDETMLPIPIQTKLKLLRNSNTK